MKSTVHRPQESVFGEDAYASLFSKASALFESLAHNHCFHNANKRSAVVSMVQFLAYNGYRFTMPPEVAEDFVVDVVNHNYTFEQMEATLEEYSEKWG